MSKAIVNNLKVVEVNKTTVLQNSPLTTDLQSQTGPCQHSVHFLLEICGFRTQKYPPVTVVDNR